MRSFFVVKLQTEVCFPNGIMRVFRAAILQSGKHLPVQSQQQKP